MTGDDDFRWLYASPLCEAACVTTVKTTDTDGVLRGFGGILEEARTLALEDVWSSFPGKSALAVRRRGDRVIAVEVNGFEGSRTEVLRRVSALGETVSAFWNVNAVTRFSYAVDGRVKTSFEVGVNAAREGEDPDCLADLVDAIDWAPGKWLTGMLRLAAEVTGRPVTENLLEGVYEVVPVAAHLGDVHPVAPGFEQLEYHHPVVASALHRAEDEALLAVARAAVDAVTEPVVLPGLPDGDDEFDELVRMAHYETSATGYRDHAPGSDRYRLVALDAVRTLRVAPNLLTAAFKTVETATLAKQMAGVDPAPMLAVFLGLLGNPPPPSGSDGARASGATPLERHAWITGHWLGLAASVTYVRDVPLARVAEAFGGTPAGRGPVSLTDTEQVALREEGGWVLAIGFNRSPFAHEVVEALRPHGTVLNVGWQTRGNRLVYYAEPGHEVAMIRPGQADVPEPLRAFTSALPEPSPEEVAAWLLALGEVVSGVAVPPESLDAEHILLDTDRKKHPKS